MSDFTIFDILMFLCTGTFLVGSVPNFCLIVSGFEDGTVSVSSYPKISGYDFPSSLFIVVKNR